MVLPVRHTGDIRPLVLSRRSAGRDSQPEMVSKQSVVPGKERAVEAGVGNHWRHEPHLDLRSHQWPAARQLLRLDLTELRLSSSANQQCFYGCRCASADHATGYGYRIHESVSER